MAEKKNYWSELKAVVLNISEALVAELEQKSYKSNFKINYKFDRASEEKLVLFQSLVVGTETRLMDIQLQ